MHTVPRETPTPLRHVRGCAACLSARADSCSPPNTSNTVVNTSLGCCAGMACNVGAQDLIQTMRRVDSLLSDDDYAGPAYISSAGACACTLYMYNRVAVD